MKKSRFSESQVVAILKEGEAGVAVAQLNQERAKAPEHAQPEASGGSR